MPETITTPEGVAFRPNLLATTSFDGSIATTYKRTVTDTVCDNTRELALSEAGQEFKVKHSRHSRLQLAPARQALEMVHALADDFAAEVERLCATPVTPAQWNRFLDRHVPRVDPRTGEPLEGRALTLADRKRGTLELLYRSDARVCPWTGTAHGVLQAVNTYEHHEGTVRGNRAERNNLKTVTGDFGVLDRRTWQTLHQLLTAA
jgi:phage/plasmid-like protein (TIGR03299 family)